MSQPLRESLPRLKRLLERLPRRRIGVLGDLMLDRYLWGTASRLSPEAAVPVVDFVEQSECLGGAGNVAANLGAHRRIARTDLRNYESSPLAMLNPSLCFRSWLSQKPLIMNHFGLNCKRL